MAKDLPGSYIPDDNPNVIKRKEQKEKFNKFKYKVLDKIPFKTKKLKKAIKEEKQKEASKTDKQKINIAKAVEDSFINAKARRATKTEGSFARGGRIGLKGGGISQRGLGRAFMKGGRV